MFCRGNALAFLFFAVHLSALGLPTGIKIWLKPDSLTTGSLQTWSDSSGHALHGTQATTTRRPTVVANSLNGYPTVSFDGVDDYLGFANYCLNSMSDGEAFIVLKASSAMPAAANALWSPGNSFTGSYPDTAGQISENFGRNALYSIGSPIQSITNFHLYNVAAWDGTWASRINGILHYDVRDSQQAYFSSQNVRLGTNSGATNYFAGDIAELIIYSSVLSTTDRETVTSYLLQKYGLGSNATAPTAPIADGISAHQVLVTWTYPTTNVQCMTEVERKDSPSGTFAKVGEVANGLSYLDGAVQPHTQYTYRVRNRTSSSTSSYSSEVTAESLYPAVRDIAFGGAATWIRADTDMTTGTRRNFLHDETTGWRPAYQRVAAKQPVLVENAVNGLPAVHFDGTDDLLTLPDYSLNWMTQGEAFGVVKATSTSPAAAKGLWALGTNSTSNYPGTTGQITENFGNVTIATGTPVQSIAGYHLYEAAAGPSYWISRLNTKIQYQSFAARTLSFGLQTVRIGGDSTRFFAGDVAELLVLPVIPTDQDRKRIQYYFTVKYGVGDTDADNLPDAWEMSNFGSLSHEGTADGDGDGLNDLEEFQNGSNPTVADTDGDGLNDGDEAHLHNTNNCYADIDGDGINDYYEVLYGLDAYTNNDLTDKDRDGLLDTDEFNMWSSFGYFSDPSRVDTNFDGLIDSVVFHTGHDPNAADYDGDGLDGSAEAAKGTSPAQADTDGDGVNDNLDDFPLDPTRSTAPTDAGDHTPPVVHITSPRFSTL